GALAKQRLEAALLELGTTLGGSPILPDDRAVHGPAALTLPQQGRLALVGDADAGAVTGIDARVREHITDCLANAVEDLFRLVLYPRGPRKVLRELAVRAREHRRVGRDQKCGGACGALIDRKKIAFPHGEKLAVLSAARQTKSTRTGGNNRGPRTREPRFASAQHERTA